MLHTFLAPGNLAITAAFAVIGGLLEGWYGVAFAVVFGFIMSNARD